MAENEYLTGAGLESVDVYDTGQGVLVVVVTPPSGRGPRRFVVLIDGVAVEPSYSDVGAASHAANVIANQRPRAAPQPGNKGPSSADKR